MMAMMAEGGRRSARSRWWDCGTTRVESASPSRISSADLLPLSFAATVMQLYVGYRKGKEDAPVEILKYYCVSNKKLT